MRVRGRVGVRVRVRPADLVQLRGARVRRVGLLGLTVGL